MERWTLGHRPALDGLRGVAIALVVFGHLRVPGLDSGGWPGVNLFFVLSGFLITTLLMDEQRRTGRVNLRAFYGRRARRLLPALALFLLFMVPALIASGTPDVMRSTTGIVFYVANWMQVATRAEPVTIEHLWSLAVEEQFYLLWPLLLIAIRPTIRVVLIAAAASALLRVAVYVLSNDLQRAYVGTDTRADALLLGCALALAFHAGYVWRPHRALVVAAVVGLLVVAAPSGTAQESTAEAQLLLGLPLSALAGTVLVAHAATTSGSLLAFLPLRGLGIISYGLYLWHAPLTALGGVIGFAGLVIAIGVSIASYILVERPIREHRRPQLVDLERDVEHPNRQVHGRIGALHGDRHVSQAGHGIADRDPA